jgi:peptidase MA superfamily protein
LKPVSLCALLAVTLGCAHARGTQSVEFETVRVSEAIFHLQYAREDARAAQQVKRALERALPATARWGTLSVPVLVTIHPTHQALEAAVHHEGQPWLRGWARYASVDLQSPRTWSTGAASDAQMAQILAHEITHCVMYQSVAGESTWRNLSIPLWFKEGMASVAAGQEHRKARHEGIRRLYLDGVVAARPPAAADPLTETGLLYQFDSDLAYATAHLAFRFLLERHGDERVRQIIGCMSKGDGFREAFQKAVGIPVQDFESEFRRYVVSGGHS